MRARLAFIVLLTAGACSEPAERPLESWEVASLQAASYNFKAYPGAVYNEPQTSLLRRAHAEMSPGAEPLQVIVLESDDPIDSVAQWYAAQHGLTPVRPSPPDPLPDTPVSFFRSGRLEDDAAAIAPLLERLVPEANPAAAKGDYRAAQLMPTTAFPRVTIQQPWFDPLENRVRPSTLIVMVREE